MIVDDDANIAELISLYLAKECYETKIVYDGEEALKVFPEFRPNIILLDLMLPGMDGYQVCRELRTTSQVPIIMLSAKGEIFQGAGSQGKSGPAPLSGGSGPRSGDSSHCSAAAGRLCGISGSDRQFKQLCRSLSGKKRGYAAKRAGTSLFPGFFPEPGIYQRTVIRPYLGL